MAGEDAQGLIPGTCQYVTSHGMRDFADGIKGRVQRCGDFPAYLGGPSVISRVLIRGKEEGQNPS